MKRKQIIALALMSVMVVSSMAVLSSCGDSAKKKDVKAKTETTQSKDEAKVPELADVKTAAIEAVKSTDLSKLTDEEKASVEKLIADYEAKINEAKDADAVEKLHTEYAAELKKLVGEQAKEDETKAAAASETAVASSAGTAVASSGGSGSSSSSGSSSGSAASTGSSSSSSSSSSSGRGQAPPSKKHQCPEKLDYHEPVYVKYFVEGYSTEYFMTCVFAPGATVTIGPNNIPAGAVVEEYNNCKDVYDPGLMAWLEERKAVYEKQWGSFTWQWWGDARTVRDPSKDAWVAGNEIETPGYYQCPECGKKFM